MQAPRESWTDERLDDFRRDVDRRFDGVDRELSALNARFDALNRTLLQVGGGMIAALLTMVAALISTHF